MKKGERDMTLIYELKEGNPEIVKKAEYSIEPKKALIAYVMQNIFHNFNTWSYPDEIKGLRESDTIKNHWYYDDFQGRRVLAAYPY